LKKGEKGPLSQDVGSKIFSPSKEKFWNSPEKRLGGIRKKEFEKKRTKSPPPPNRKPSSGKKIEKRKQIQTGRRKRTGKVPAKFIKRPHLS